MVLPPFLPLARSSPLAASDVARLDSPLAARRLGDHPAHERTLPSASVCCQLAHRLRVDTRPSDSPAAPRATHFTVRFAYELRDPEGGVAGGRTDARQGTPATSASIDDVHVVSSIGVAARAGLPLVVGDWNLRTSPTVSRARKRTETERKHTGEAMAADELISKSHRHSSTDDQPTTAAPAPPSFVARRLALSRAPLPLPSPVARARDAALPPGRVGAVLRAVADDEATARMVRTRESERHSETTTTRDEMTQGTSNETTSSRVQPQPTFCSALSH